MGTKLKMIHIYFFSKWRFFFMKSVLFVKIQTVLKYIKYKNERHS